MENIILVCAVVTGLASVAGIAIAAIIWFKRIVEGVRCQLRQTMLDIYYRHKDERKIRQYEAEHFDKCYHAYKALKGNSFIDKINEEVMSWKVIS